MLLETAEENGMHEAQERLLNKVDSFRRRYNSVYPSGPLLLLTPRNENDKVVSSQSLNNNYYFYVVLYPLKHILICL